MIDELISSQAEETPKKAKKTLLASQTKPAIAAGLSVRLQYPSA